MTKKPQRLLLTTILLSILIISSTYAILTPSAHASEITTQQKGLTIISNVVGLDTSKYTVDTKNYPQDAYLGVLPQENVRYDFNSSNSKLSVLSTFINGKLEMMHVLNREGPTSTTKSTSNMVETAQDFLTIYQRNSGNAFYGGLSSTLNSIDANKNLTRTFGNTKLEVITGQDRATFKWTYILDGIEAPDKAVTLNYENGFLKLFFDSWDLYKIGSTSVNVSESEAMDLAMARVASDDGSFAVKNFTMTGAMVIETVFRSSIVADTPRNEDLLMLYPMRHVWISLDKFYPPGNVYGFNVYVWADTGKICHAQERFTSIDLLPELVSPINDTSVKPLNNSVSSVETLNSLTTIWLVFPLLLAVTLVFTKVWLRKKKGLPVQRFSKIAGVLLCLLIFSMILVPIATVAATHPYSRATIWGSESTGAWDPNIPPDGASWRKHPNEVDKQQETAEDIEGSFDWNGYNADNYQGSNGLGSGKTAILAQIDENEANYPRIAVVDFDHGNWRDDYQQDYGERHYLFEDNQGTWHDSAWHPENGVYDMDIYSQTTGKTFFAFISTCNSANIEVQDYNNGKPQGMVYAWAHQWVTDPDTTPPNGYMSGNAYSDADNGNFVYLGFVGGSASLSLPVSGSGPYYYTWVEQFFAYGLIYDMTVNEALDHASASLWSGADFDETPLGREAGFTSIWPLYRNGAWDFTSEDLMGNGRLMIYGNGDIKLYQPLLTVNAYDVYSNPVSANVYIDNEYMGTTGNGFRVSDGIHTVSVDSSSYAFRNFAGHSDFENPIQISVNSATTVTANYYANPSPQYTLTITAGEGGSTNPSPDSYVYFPQSKPVTAIPSEGYVFDHWELDNVQHNENPVYVPMNDDHELQAVFREAVYYYLTVNAYDAYLGEYYPLTPNVYIDDILIGTAPISIPEIEGSYHTVSVDYTVYDPYWPEYDVPLLDFTGDCYYYNGNNAYVFVSSDSTTNARYTQWQ